MTTLSRSAHRSWLRITVWLAVTALVVVSAYFLWESTRPRVPRMLRVALEDAESFELYSLHPFDKPVAGEPAFQGYRILGRVEIRDGAERSRLISALYAGATNSTTAANCFNPRHAIHVRYDGHQYALVICFQCLFSEAYRDGERVPGFRTFATPQADFDASLRAHGIPLAPKTRDEGWSVAADAAATVPAQSP